MSNQAYIFDMDGVLADNCRYHVLAWRVFSERHGFALTDEQVLEWMGAANRVYMERLLGRPVAGDELTALEDEKESIYRELYAPHLRIPEGLRAFLDRAHAANIPCGVATGAPQQNIDFILDGPGSISAATSSASWIRPSTATRSPHPTVIAARPRFSASPRKTAPSSRTPWPASSPRTPPACAWSPSRPPIPARRSSPLAPTASSTRSRNFSRCVKQH